MSDSFFRGWDNFHFLTGSAAAGLIGLLFVVITLARSTPERAVSIYLTPTVRHFTVVLMTSAVAMAPRVPVLLQAAVFGFSALYGCVDAVRGSVAMRARTPGAVPPHWSDFWLYGVLPAAVYFGFAAASLALALRAPWAVHATAAFMLAFLLIGIRNAWDLVTWIARTQRGEEKRASERGGPDVP